MSLPASRQWTLLSAVALLALFVRLLYIHEISAAPFFNLRLGDALAYHEWALRIVRGDWRGEGVFYQAPLYPYFLAVVYKLFGDGTSMVRFIQAVIGSGSCVLLAAAGITLFGEWGALAGVLLAIYPPAIFMDGLLEKSALVGVLTSALLYLLSARHVRFHEALAGVVLGLLSLTRENSLLLAVPISFWFLSGDRSPVEDGRRDTPGPSVTAASAFLAGCVLILLPVGFRNYAAGGEFHLTTVQFGPNFYIGNHAGAKGLYVPLLAGRGSAAEERGDATALAEQAAGRTLTPEDVSSFWTGRAVEFIRAEPVEWAGQLVRKLALTYNAAEIADTESHEVYAEFAPVLRVLAPITFGVILCLAAFGVCVTAGSWRRLWCLYAIALTYTLSVVVFYVFARYRFPLVLVLMIFAAGGLVSWRLVAIKSIRLWAGAAVLAAGLIAYLPLVDTRSDRVAHELNIANAFLHDPGKTDQAAIYYEKALAEMPQQPAAHFGMGMVLAGACAVRRRRPRGGAG